MFPFLRRVSEAHLPMNQSHDDLRYTHLPAALQAAHGWTDASPWSERPYVVDVFPSHVVYSHKGQMYRRSYTATAAHAGATPTVKLGDHRPVHRAYVTTLGAAEEAEARLFLDETPADTGSITVREGITFLSEVTAKESGVSKIPIKIIAPGWGSSAYYSEEVLKRDGPKVFAKGTHMMWNHASESELQDRPEGDLSDLAAVLTKDAYWDANGPKGPGLYSEAKVFSDYATQVAEKGPHIGVSINAAIRGREGTAEGRQGRICEEFVRAYSTDFVTKAGAGGAPIVTATEAQRGSLQEQSTMTEQETRDMEALRTQIRERDATIATQNTRLAALERSQHQVIAIGTVAALLNEAEIPFNRRLLERACEHPVIKDGKPDPEWVKSVVADFTEGHDGRVEDLGERETVSTESRRQAGDVEVTDKMLREALKDLGVPEAGLDFAVRA